MLPRFPYVTLAPDEGAAGGMPAAPAGEMPPESAGPALGLPTSPPPDAGDAELGGGSEGEDTPEGGEGAPPAGAPPQAAPAPPGSPIPSMTPAQEGLTQAAWQLIQVRDHVQQRYPVIAQERQMIEGLLQGVQYDDLAPQQQVYAAQMYQRWQALVGEERQLQGQWKQFQDAVPMLQAAAEIEQQRAMMNRVGEPMAHRLLAQRAAERSGDASFPVDAMTEFLNEIPPNALEVVATKLETFWRKHARGERAAGRVDAMGPDGGSPGDWRRASGRDLIRSAVADELRRNPPRT